MKKNKTALVLSGGGSLGIAHIGVIENLELQHDFDFVCGVSAGAIVGAGVALGKSAEEIWDIFNDTNLFDIALDASPKNSGLIKGRKIYKLLDEVFESKRFSDLKTPLYIGATNFATGERVIIQEGKIADAVRASIGIPLVFEPHWHPDLKQPLVDGFLSQNLPLDIAINSYKGKQIISVDVATVPPLTPDFGSKKFFGKNRTRFHMLQRTLRIMYQNQQRLIPDDLRVIRYEPDLREFSSMSVGHKNFQRILEIGKNCRPLGK